MSRDAEAVWRALSEAFDRDDLPNGTSVVGLDDERLTPLLAKAARTGGAVLIVTGEHEQLIDFGRQP